MSSDEVIRAEGLGKDYRVDTARGPGYTTLREQIMASPGRLVRRRREGRPSQTLSALSDLSFTVAAGETLGFIGHNGAGKSTLLKLLSRITPPTRGRAEIRGRVGSLLEVGTGFHPELTGRENIFLNGAILGMRRTEILRRFDEIVEFAEVGAQLDTPVKRYSSGQFVRLAFSVAAHLEPDVLLVDEVLAVGDASFQRRSIARMTQIARSGRTVLFVSHNMATVQALCSRAIVLDHGRLIADGPVDAAIATYVRTLEALAEVDLSLRDDRDGRLEVRVVDLLVTGGTATGGALCSGSSARFEVVLSGLLPDTSVLLKVHDDLGQPVCSFDSSLTAPYDVECGDAPVFVCEVDELPLVEGRYRLDVVVRGRGGKRQDDLVGAVHFDVLQGLLRERPVTREALGRVAVPHRWSAPRS